MAGRVKKETLQATSSAEAQPGSRTGDVPKALATVIDLSSSSSSSGSSDGSDSDVDAVVEGICAIVGEDGGGSRKKRKMGEVGEVLPIGVLDPAAALTLPEASREIALPELSTEVAVSSCKQFWKAGDYEGARCADWDSSAGKRLIPVPFI